MTWRSLIKLLLSCSILLTVSYLVYNSHVPLQGGSENLPRPRAAPEQPHLDPQPCMCQPGSVQLKDKIPKNQFDKVFQRRKDELSKQKKRTSSELSKLLLAPANSPLQYPIQGFTARPLRISPIPDIKSKVTITIKTFLRYNNLKVLLSSIRRFYPTVPVILADDSIEPEKIQEENVQQYIMPPAQGWFAGRNLAVSQVTTKYFLWADDDFVFTEDTKIEKFLNVMEAVPELDVVGGSVQGNQFFFSLEYDEGVPDEGGCLYRKSMGSFQTLQGYPQCTLANGVVNFFLARTDSVQKSRFDPLLKRVAHSEWFMDGLGSLMVASCSDVTIGHQPRKKNAEYEKYRRPTDLSDAVFKYQLHFFKNNLKCIKFG